MAFRSSHVDPGVWGLGWERAALVQAWGWEGCLCLSWGRTMARLVLVEGTGHRPDCSQLLTSQGSSLPNPRLVICGASVVLQLLKLSHLWACSQSVPWWEHPFHAGHLPVKGKGCSRVSTGENRGPWEQGSLQSWALCPGRAWQRESKPLLWPSIHHQLTAGISVFG